MSAPGHCASGQSAKLLAVAMERPAKLRKLNAMRARLPYTSKNALAALLRVARDGDLPDVVRTHDIRRARDAPFVQERGTSAVSKERSCRREARGRRTRYVRHDLSASVHPSVPSGQHIKI